MKRLLGFLAIAQSVMPAAPAKAYHLWQDVINL
jgi:hypothetical protein